MHDPLPLSVLAKNSALRSTILVPLCDPRPTCIYAISNARAGLQHFASLWKLQLLLDRARLFSWLYRFIVSIGEQGLRLLKVSVNLHKYGCDCNQELCCPCYRVKMQLYEEPH